MAVNHLLRSFNHELGIVLFRAQRLYESCGFKSCWFLESEFHVGTSSLSPRRIDTKVVLPGPGGIVARKQRFHGNYSSYLLVIVNGYQTWPTVYKNGKKQVDEIDFRN